MNRLLRFVTLLVLLVVLSACGKKPQTTTLDVTTLDLTTSDLTTQSASLNSAYDMLTIEGDLTQVVDNLVLVNEINNEVSVSWTSSDEDVISNIGLVTRSDDGNNKEVTLSAKLSYNGDFLEKEFVVNVISLEEYIYFDSSDLFFSEYIEGGSNNKALEIYNGTGLSVDLSEYTIETYNNGSESITNEDTLSGILENGEVFVIGNPDADSGISSVSNISSFVTWVNGDDFIVLKHNDVIIDSIGRLGEDLGSDWSGGNPLVSTKEMTLVRKPHITSGDVIIDDVFDPSLEWIGYSTDTFDYIGYHEANSSSGTGESELVTASHLVPYIEDLMPNEAENNINLPRSHPQYGGNIVWNSNNISSISNEGIVSRESEDALVTLLATLTYRGEVMILSFDIMVPKTGIINTGSYPKINENPDEVLIKYIDLGKYGLDDMGESIYIKAGDIDILVDAGGNNSDSNKAIEEVIDEFSNDRVLDYVIASHPHSDHIGGMSTIFDTYQVLFLIESAGSYSTSATSYYENAVDSESGLIICNSVESVNNQGSCSKVYTIAPSVSIELFDTGYLTSGDANDSSVVFVFEAFGTRVLFNGDAEHEQEANYADNVGDIDILKMGHHGSKHATYPYLLTNTKPEVVIITNGNKLANANGHPRYESINRVYEYNDDVFIFATTGGGYNSCDYSQQQNYKCLGDPFEDRNGTITVSIKSSGYSLSSSLGDELTELSDTDFWIEHQYANSEHDDSINLSNSYVIVRRKEYRF